ncbi:MAG: putative DNA binding domain-containing protein [Dysgonamonadaceae bacterium]|jgi:ATP-dependent DNA helicase RecG|nr:putative DNA binding domain-containing protein [Dysgonamonadaceae bacterium]
MAETLNIEYKSIQKIRTGDKGFKDLAVTCVSLANAQGGKIFVGFEDKTKQPPIHQIIRQNEINDAVTRLRSLCFNVALAGSEMMIYDNGSHYFTIDVSPSLKSIATTSDGKIYLRIADKCEPVRNEDIHRLAYEKQAYQWELVCPQTVKISDVSVDAIRKFADAIRQSDRVSGHIKQMTDEEIIENYNFASENFLTYLGILWLGNARQRSRIAYPITVQYIVYDQLERKIRKEDWHDNSLNPAELLLDIERKAIELTYFHEFPDGLFRKQIRHYHPKVLRELLLNAVVHKSLTISGDIMIEIYPDRLEISNPGGLPLGVTKDNILHARQRRNPYFIRVMHDLKLMEGEGSGYDLIYELNALDSKELPQVNSDFNSTTVIQTSKIVNEEILPVLDYVTRNYDISQKNLIALGLIARHKKLLSTELDNLLQLDDNKKLRSYTDNLVNLGILITQGIKKGRTFLVNPKVIANSKANMKTSLKTIEPYRLKALIEEDLRLHPLSYRREIQQRLPDVTEKDLKKYLYEMVKSGRLTSEGGKTFRQYKLSENSTV